MALSNTARSSGARLTAALLFAAALAGCQAPASSGPPPPPPAFAAPNFGSPAFGSTSQAASPMQRTATLSSSSKSWVTPDGTRHTKSSSTTASVRVDPNAMGNAAAMLFGAMMGQPGTAPAPVTKGQIAGDWNVEVDGKQCRLSLRPTGAGMGDFASTFGCMGTDLQSVSSWSLRGNEVVLTGMMSKRVAVLALNGTNRMDGTADGSSGRIIAWR
ncbi:AprI/Inh family metalloprotease inhibitor [Stappia indica]|uniref:AprI/Inh family metalloprotease inhibitor n=1 Tax=Stappia indica TaxID=538381 RepID=A0A857C6A5_9HYPH|nr:AprI/Inh family metalloprotease inhibitor [Stappia indica]QGZ34437.1 AprI/Inh family metalloprotease inhibitor [Stappia indica]